MTTRQRSSLFILTVGVLLLGTAMPALGQSPLEQWAENQISEKTGIDPSLLATLFVDSGEGQFILSFVFINEEVMQSNLRDELKESIRPYVGQRAMMAMIVPTKESTFQPSRIAFAQNDASFLLNSSAIHPITSAFRAGPVPTQEVNAGVLELPQGLNLEQAFNIKYGSEFQTTFSLQPASSESSGGSAGGQGTRPVDTSEIQNFLLWLLQFLFMALLFPFLI